MVQRFNSWIDSPGKPWTGPARRQAPVHGSHFMEAGRCSACGVRASWRGAELECGASVRYVGARATVDAPSLAPIKHSGRRKPITLTEARERGLVPASLTSLWLRLPEPPERLTPTEWASEVLAWATDHRNPRRASA